jgi:hypothetical protein
MFWVTQYPVDDESMQSIDKMFRANINERCDKEEETYDPSMVFINGSTVIDSPFKVPDGDIAGVYWWEYLD